LEWVIITPTAAESVAEVVVVFIVHVGLFGVYSTSSVGCLVQTKGAWACGRNTLGTTIACEVALLEDLDEVMLAVALNGASIAYTGGCPVVALFGRRRIASQACEDSLSQRSEDFGACVDTLKRM
jgi:hypothetical protein